MTTIQISVSDQINLGGLWRVAISWLAAANGFNAAYKHPVARLLARDQARVRLDEYFAAIEELVAR